MKKLFFGGFLLAQAVVKEGVDKTLAGIILRLLGEKPVMVMVLLGIMLVTAFSNTAAANLILPIGISYAMENMASTNNAPIQVGMSIALAASLAMALPISTPPNTIAYVKGDLVSKDFMRNGVIIGVLSLVLIYAFGGYIINFWLRL